MQFTPEEIEYLQSDVEALKSAAQFNEAKIAGSDGTDRLYFMTRAMELFHAANEIDASNIG